LAPELILGAVCGALGYKLQDLILSCKVVQKTAIPRRNSTGDAQEWPELADTYVPSGNSTLHPASQRIHCLEPEGYRWYKQSAIRGFGTFGIQRSLMISDS